MEADWAADFLEIGGVWARRGEARSTSRTAARDRHMRGFYTKGQGVLTQRSRRAEHGAQSTEVTVEEKQGQEQASASVMRTR